MNQSGFHSRSLGVLWPLLRCTLNGWGLIRRDASQPWASEQQPLRYVGTATLGSRTTTQHHCGTSESIAHEVSRPMPPRSHVVFQKNGIFSMNVVFHSPFWMFFLSIGLVAVSF